jgi:hypothetical protein
MVDRRQLLNMRFARVLGWTPREFGAIDFDAILRDAIESFQRRQVDLTVDGIMGPSSYHRWLQIRFNAERPGLINGDSAEHLLERAGGLAVLVAKNLWLHNIVDPPRGGLSEHAESRTLIDRFIREGLGWDFEPFYEGDGSFEWCGAYCAFAWASVGLAEAWRKAYFASTYRLDRYAKYRPLETFRPPPPSDAIRRRYLQLDEHSGPLAVTFAAPGESSDSFDDPQPGDILLVGPVNSDYGKHICLVEAYDAVTGVFTTLEGNATGLGPRGNRHHGVIRTTRRVGLDRGDAPSAYHARRLIRPAPSDLDP